jgi:hypothetical protein
MTEKGIDLITGTTEDQNFFVFQMLVEKLLI